MIITLTSVLLMWLVVDATADDTDDDGPGGGLMQPTWSPNQ